MSQGCWATAHSGPARDRAWDDARSFSAKVAASMVGKPIAEAALMRNVALIVVGLVGALAMGCDGGKDPRPEPEQTGTIPEQLEALEVAFAAAQPIQVSGALTITGSDRDFHVSVGGEQLDLHSPGATPLGSLDGLDGTVQITEQGMGGQSIVISDEAGVVYIGALGDGMSLDAVAEHFGSGFARWGEETGSQTDGTFVWSYKPAIFATDAGDVELTPGQVETITVEGVDYRIVVSAAYTVGTNPDADELPGCGPEDMLGFELLRVDEPVVASVIERLPDEIVAYVGCTAPGGGDGE